MIFTILSSIIGGWAYSLVGRASHSHCGDPSSNLGRSTLKINTKAMFEFINDSYVILRLQEEMYKLYGVQLILQNLELIKIFDMPGLDISVIGNKNYLSSISLGLRDNFNLANVNYISKLPLPLLNPLDIIRLHWKDIAYLDSIFADLLIIFGGTGEYKYLLEHCKLAIIIPQSEEEANEWISYLAEQKRKFNLIDMSTRLNEQDLSTLKRQGIYSTVFEIE